MRDIIIHFQTSDTWKLQLTIAVIFVSSKDAEEERVIHSRSENMKITSYNDENKLGLRDRDNLETSMRRRDFIFDLVHLIYCKRHKVIFRCVGSYIDSPD